MSHSKSDHHVFTADMQKKGSKVRFLGKNQYGGAWPPWEMF
ncbi:hypothetical protein [Vibrio sp. JPW-9-11-11]|nr:hypothetical protein [Vibrio sp. JPW-9-11-11]